MYSIISLLIFLDHHPEIEHNDPTYHPQYTEPLNNAEDPGEQGLYKFYVISLSGCALMLCVHPMTQQKGLNTSPMTFKHIDDNSNPNKKSNIYS